MFSFLGFLGKQNEERLSFFFLKGNYVLFSFSSVIKLSTILFFRILSSLKFLFLEKSGMIYKI